MAMAVYYQAAVQVPRRAGFWCPHTEWQYEDSPRLGTIGECMHWLAGRELAKDRQAEYYIDVVINGYMTTLWYVKDVSSVIFG